jgi:nucleoside-diphosphate-sugar epimerase
MASLITGGTGLVGAELAHILVNLGEEVVLFNRSVKSPRLADIEKKVKWVQGDVANWNQVFGALQDYSIDYIYHTGAMLTAVSEQDPWGSFNTNVVGTRNVLEAARLFKVKKMMFTSSIGTFGLETGEIISDTTIQRPTGIYGINKLYCEGLGRYYRQKYGLDFRSVRYAAVVGPSVQTPGHWVPPMIEDAMMGKPHRCQVTENNRTWMISLKDAARAAYQVLEAPKESIRMVNYNVSGPVRTVSAREVAEAIKKFIPEAKITFQKDQNLPGAHEGHLGRDFDDSYARREWGWQPEHPDVERIVGTFIRDMRKNLKPD